MADRDFPGRWTAQKNDVVGGWIVTSYPHPLSEHHRYSGDPDVDPDVRPIADCITESDANYLAMLLNAHESAAAFPVEIRHMLRMALVGDRHMLYFDSAEFHAFIDGLVNMLPGLIENYAMAATENSDRIKNDIERQLRGWAQPNIFINLPPETPMESK